MRTTKSLLPVLGLGSTLSAGAQNRLEYLIQDVPFTQMELTNNFWLPRLKTEVVGCERIPS